MESAGRTHPTRRSRGAQAELIQAKHLYRDEWLQLITHGSIIRAVADYVQIALQGQGHIALADAPTTESSFPDVCRVTGTADVAAYFDAQGPLALQLVDIRQEEWEAFEFTLVGRRALQGDPEGYREVRLNEQSEFMTHPKGL